MLDALTRFPILAFGAICFYVFLVACLHPRIRNWAAHTFELEPTSNGWTQPELDTLRGFAAMLVAYFHCWQWLRPYNDGLASTLPFIMQGDKGVPIFAALSGLLIYGALRRHALSVPLLKDYCKRRFLRIYPLFAAVTLTALVAGQMRQDPTLLHGIASEFFMLQVLRFPHRVVLPTWSIHVEVIFYIMLPIIMIWLGRNVAQAAVILMLASLVVGHSASRSFQLVPFFCCGVLAWSLARSTLLRGRLASTVCLISGCLLLVADFSGLRLSSRSPTPFDAVRSPELCFAMMLILAALSSGYAKVPGLSAWPLRAIGVISYSIYLWHTVLLTLDVPGLQIDGFGRLSIQHELPPASSVAPFAMVLLPGIVFWSALSYVAIERPFLRRRQTVKVE